MADHEIRARHGATPATIARPHARGRAPHPPPDAVGHRRHSHHPCRNPIIAILINILIASLRPASIAPSVFSPPASNCNRCPSRDAVAMSHRLAG